MAKRSADGQRARRAKRAAACVGALALAASAAAQQEPPDDDRELERIQTELEEAAESLEAAARELARISAEAMEPIVEGMRRQLRELERRQSAEPWASLELAPLSPELGRYFGTDEGVLVVRADDDVLGLRDGDVILDIGGRTPTSPEHAKKILASYAPGETLRLTIMRDRQRQMLESRLPPEPAGEDGPEDRERLGRP
ncbi:MAG TPA: PDZ domain-containing protein [Gammaproteobacteria bacterium]